LKHEGVKKGEAVFVGCIVPIPEDRGEARCFHYYRYFIAPRFRFFTELNFLNSSMVFKLNHEGVKKGEAV